jgi:DNA-binding phage protein
MSTEKRKWYALFDIDSEPNEYYIGFSCNAITELSRLADTIIARYSIASPTDLEVDIIQRKGNKTAGAIVRKRYFGRGVWEDVPMKTIDEFMTENFTKDKIDEINRNVEIKAKAIRQSQEFTRRFFASLKARSHLTDKALSEKTGISRSHLSRLKKGDISPSIDTIARIASLLGFPVNFDQLLPESKDAHQTLKS